MNLSVHHKNLLQQYFADKPVKKAYLFGSYARGTAVKEVSDIDIMVELDHSSPIGMRFFVFESELADLLKQKVDLVSAAGISKYVRPTIDKEKILIYDRAAS
jgi:predicted nucleotidyltransferase